MLHLCIRKEAKKPFLLYNMSLEQLKTELQVLANNESTCKVKVTQGNKVAIYNFVDGIIESIDLVEYEND